MATEPHPALSESKESAGSTQATSPKAGLVYEIGYHLVPTLSDADAVAQAAAIRTQVEKAGGSVLSAEEPKRMTLAFRIERSEGGARGKYTESYFGWVKFEGPEELHTSVPMLKDSLTGNDRILRFMLVETVREAPQPVRNVFSSDRLAGETIRAPKRAEEKGGEVSEAELEKGIESLITK